MSEKELRKLGLTDLPADNGAWVLLTKEQFRDGVRAGIYDTDTGKGFYATKKLVSNLEASLLNFCTDRKMKAIPEFVTHVIWYPKQQP